MGARKKKEYTSGEATNYVTRKQAMRKLQLNLKDFRRLCIIKGIHPREPRNRKRAQKGNLTTVQTLFHEKDIRFLLHEPIVFKFRDFKVFLKKLKKAQDKGNTEAAERLKSNKPKYSLDHIVKERYPTFIDAIRDLEDCLCLCFLYATFPRNIRTPTEMIDLCRKLTVEFMHYVVEAKALRKVFVSIKGYYFQAEIMGQTVTWIVPHTFAYKAPEMVDLKLMSIFVEFYTTMLGFVNFRLYHNLNLKYPPTLPGFQPNKVSSEGQEEVGKSDSKYIDNELKFDMVSALNCSLVRTVANIDDEEEVELDDIPMVNDQEEDPEKAAAAKEAANNIRNLKTLFKGLKFFINREVPRENLVFMIRAFGGEVSWDKSVHPGSIYDEDHSGITHQICDRPKETLDMKHVGRYYVQPQWIFDSINMLKLLPVHDYFIGKTLPPHLSPFITDRRIGDYMPPEEKQLLGLEEKPVEENEDDEEEEEENMEEVEEEEEEEDDEEEEEEEEEETPKMRVEVGMAEVEDKDKTKKALEEEEYRLRKMMIPKKHRGLHRSMMKARKRRVHESKQLERKRKEFDVKEKEKKQKEKKTTTKKKVSI